MTLARTIVVLAGALATMLSVVMLRTETTHQQHQTAQLDRRTETLLEEIREQELELARLRNPELIKGRVQDFWERSDEAQKPAARPKRP